MLCPTVSICKEKIVGFCCLIKLDYSVFLFLLKSRCFRYEALKKVMEEKKKEMEKQMELQAVEVSDGHHQSHQNGGYQSRQNSVRADRKYEPRFHREVISSSHLSWTIKSY